MKPYKTLHELGIKMHRLVENGKKPITKGKFTGDHLDDILNHEGNIGVITGELSGIIVLDLDVHNHNQQSGIESLKQLIRENGELPPTYSVLTPSGGIHLYFKLPNSWRGIRFAPKLEAYPQLDFRNNGQYVVAEGSNIDGEYYSRRTGSPNEMAYIPEWLLEIYKKGVDPKQFKPRELNALGKFINKWGTMDGNTISTMAYSGAELPRIKRLAWYVNQSGAQLTKEEFLEIYNKVFDIIKRDGIELKYVNKLGVFLNNWYEGVQEGGRNLYMASMTGRMFASGADYDKIYNIVQVVNNTACEPPLPQDEVNLVYNSMLRTEQRRTSIINERLDGNAS